MKKVLHGLLVMGAAAVISVGATSYAAEAAAPAVKGFTVDYANQKITITDTANAKLYVAKATIVQRKKNPKDKESTEMVTTVRTAAPTEYDKTDREIDLSVYGVAKDVYLSIWGNVNTDPILIKVPAAKTRLKATVNAVDTTVKVEDITDKKNPVSVTGLEYCTTNGKWADYTASTNLKTYTASGATLRFRIKASANAALATTATEIVGTTEDGATVTAYKGTGNFASNELKVRIAKKANGPRATIDYNNRTVTVPTTCEYRSSQAAAARQTVTYTSAATQATPDANGRLPKTVKLPVETLFFKVSGAAKATEFDIRTAATDKKPASKITEYQLPLVGTLTVTAGAAAAPGTLDVTRAGNTIKIGTATEDIAVTKLTLNSRTMAGTMTVKNNSKNGYQFIVADAQTATKVSALDLPEASDRITATVAAGRTVNIPVKSGKYVYVRKAANVKTQEWSTPYVYYGIVMNTKE